MEGWYRLRRLKKRGEQSNAAQFLFFFALLLRLFEAHFFLQTDSRDMHKSELILVCKAHVKYPLWFSSEPAGHRSKTASKNCYCPPSLSREIPRRYIDKT